MRSEYIRECSTNLEVDEKVIYPEMNKIRRKHLETKFQSFPDPVRASFDIPVQPIVPSFVEQVYSEPEEREIIYFLLKFGNDILRLNSENNATITVSEYIIREIQNDNLEFQNLIYKQIFEDVKNAIERDHTITHKYFIFHDNPQIRDLAVEIFTSKYEISKVWKRKDTYIELPGENLGTEVPKSLLAYKNKIIMMAREKVTRELENASLKGMMEQVAELQKQIINLDRVKIALSKELGERTILSFMIGYKG
jgi:DNA primase